MKKFLAVMAMVLSFSASAASQSTVVDVSKLTPEQREQVKSIVAQKADEQTIQKVDAVLNRVEQFGASAARGLVGFAKELGTEANSFAQTPLGVVVAAVTVLHFFGAQITGLILGIFLLFILTPIFATLAVRSFRVYDYTYETKPVLFGLWQRRFVVNMKRRAMYDSEQFKVGVLLAATTVCFIAGCINFAL